MPCESSYVTYIYGSYFVAEALPQQHYDGRLVTLPDLGSNSPSDHLLMKSGTSGRNFTGVVLS